MTTPATTPQAPAAQAPSAQAPARLTCGELYAEATRVARSLLRLIRPGEYAAIWAPNVAEWPVMEYGAALAGVTLVALNPVLRPHELTYG